jgi:hypothetical protein
MVFTMGDPVLLQRDGAIATLTLNRPDVLNVLDESMVARLLEHATAIANEAAVRAVVLRGADRTSWQAAISTCSRSCAHCHPPSARPVSSLHRAGARGTRAFGPTAPARHRASTALVPDSARR